MNRMGDTSHNDRVQDGRHLMNGTRWLTGGNCFEPPTGASNILGVRPATLEDCRRDSWQALADSFKASAAVIPSVYRV